MNEYVKYIGQDFIEEAKAIGANVVFKLDNSAGEIEVDKQKFDSILTNLLINALKHSFSGGIITISTENIVENDSVKISVSDQGHGLKGTDPSMLFRRFYQGAGEETGTGIGLSYSKILVEMQRGEQRYFKDRSIYYASFPIREQGQKGEWDYRLKAVYIIGILNFTFENEDTNYYHHKVQLMDHRTHKVFYDKLTFIYLEMPKFNKEENELKNMFEKWLFVLRNLSRLMERPKALQERIFTKLFEAAEIAKFTPTEYRAYEDSLKVYRDWINTIRTAEYKGHQEGLEEGLEKGREEGRKEGREEGMKEERISNAKNFKRLGVPSHVIAQATGLTEEEIEQL